MILPVATALLLVSPALAAGDPIAPWATYRGNPQRTGNTDGQAGPATPKVLWAHKTQEHFIASPVPLQDRLLVTGLGAFNVPVLYNLGVEPAANPRIRWSKSVPLLKLPSVSSPAVADGKLIFGDGMHQTDGAALYCLRADKGQQLWRLMVPGTLVHLEGSPTVTGGKVYLGGGAAGVLCVSLDRVSLDGKEMTLPAIQKLLDAQWADLLAKYEIEKKKDPVFAVPPSEDQLPKPAPIKLWQQGQDKWHVDAPVNVLGDQVLVASAFLDKEMVGDRALFSLDAATGSIKWRMPLRINPWGGPSVVGQTVVVTGSSIGYDTHSLKGARGEIVAFNLADGKEKWHKEVPAGMVSCVALTADTAIATATDGKVRAYDLASGETRWIYDGKTHFFAPPAVAGTTVYVGDLKGQVHAIGLADGSPRWKLDLATDPAVMSPGMIYAGPVVQGGRVFVATCNLEGANARQPTVVVCIGQK